jgi:hypothetical protein
MLLVFPRISIGLPIIILSPSVVFGCQVPGGVVMSCHAANGGFATVQQRLLSKLLKNWESCSSPEFTPLRTRRILSNTVYPFSGTGNPARARSFSIVAALTHHHLNIDNGTSTYSKPFPVEPLTLNGGAV